MRLRLTLPKQFCLTFILCLSQMQSNTPAFAEPERSISCDEAPLVLKGPRFFGLEKIEEYKKTAETKIRRNWFPPRDANACSVSFDLKSNGSIERLKISRSSGQLASDQAALAAVDHAKPFNPLPRGLNSAAVEFDFDYSVFLRRPPSPFRFTKLTRASEERNENPAE